MIRLDNSMPLTFNFFIFLFGLSAGSFLNCVIYRMELQENMPQSSPLRKAVSFLRGKSHCPNCKHVLIWQDLIPVFSFLFLKGQCKYCSKRISLQYPLVEIATGLIFLLIFNSKFSNLINLSFLLYIASSLIIIFIYDLKFYIIPDKILFPVIVITFLYRLFENLVISNFIFLNHFLAALTAAGFFLAIFLVSQGRWMGFGDVKLALFMGLFLGYPDILVALLLAFFLGAIIGVGLIILGNKNLKSEVPFGPFLITGTLLALLWGQDIMRWYMYLF